ncbi:MAG: STAS/SEC14 domain-containing protein [Thalassotalea sp.]
MASRISIIESLEIIKVLYTGHVSLDERVNILHEICTDYHRKFPQLKVLIDARKVTQAMTQAEQLVFGTYVASRDEMRKALVAVIVNPGQIINDMAISESSKLGHKVNLFNSEDDALAWLASATI